MNEEEKILKAAFRGADCPPMEKLLAALDGSFEGHEAARIRSHMEACIACQSEADLFEDFRSGQVKTSEREDVDWVVSELRRRAAASEPPTARPRVLLWPRLLSAGGWKAPAAIAAMALLAVVILQWPGGDVTGPPLPSPSGVVRSGTMALLEPLGEQPALPQRWRWQPAPGAHYYLVRFLEVDGREVTTVRTSLAEMETPEMIQQFLGSGRRIQWQVLARDAGDNTLNSSPLQPVFLRSDRQ